METALQEAAPQCPRCQSAMLDPNGLGWCRSCGYCRTLEDERAKALPPASPAATGRQAAANALSVIGRAPSWLYVLVLGMGLFAVVTLLPAKKLPPVGTYERALWT
jgi:hypothetical protein